MSTSVSEITQGFYRELGAIYNYNSYRRLWDAERINSTDLDELETKMNTADEIGQRMLKWRPQSSEVKSFAKCVTTLKTQLEAKKIPTSQDIQRMENSHDILMEKIKSIGIPPQSIKTIALKTLCVLGMVLGSVLAIGGGVAFGIAFSAVVITLGAIFWPLAYLFGVTSVALCTNPITALGGAVTIPATVIFAAIPFLPCLSGALPGVAVIALSAWGWRVLSK